MWVIPKKLDTSAYVPDTVELISDSQELSKILERSVLWRSKPSPSKTWSRRLKRDCSISRLFTQILKPSHSESFEDAWTSSLEASLVSPLASPDNAQGQKTQDIYSPTFSKASQNVDLPLFSLKMSKESSQVNSKETAGTIPKGRPFCCMSSESWKEWVTRRRQEYSVRLKSVRLTKEKECSSQLWISPAAQASASQEPLFTKEGAPWKGDGRAYRADGTHKSMTLDLQAYATPQAEDKSNTDGNPQGRWATPKATPTGMTARTRGRPIEKSTHLTTQVWLENQVNWATPTASEGNKISNNPESKGQRGLSNDPALRWTTPIARDVFEISLTKPVAIRKDGRSRMDTMPRQVHPQQKYRGKLNPRWVETLMGVCVGWTMPSCASPWTIERTSSDCSGTESCPRQPREHSISCGENWPTPPACSAKDSSYTTYLRKCINRVKAGGAPFAPTLQVSVENPNADTSLFKDLDLSKDTEQLIKEIKGENWATPTTRDWKGAYSEENQKKKPRNLLLDQVKAETILDPVFVYLVALLKNENPKKGIAIHILLLKRNINVQKLRKEYRIEESPESYIERVLNA